MMDDEVTRQGAAEVGKTTAAGKQGRSAADGAGGPSADEEGPGTGGEDDPAADDDGPPVGDAGLFEGSAAVAAEGPATGEEGPAVDDATLLAALAGLTAESPATAVFTSASPEGNNDDQETLCASAMTDASGVADNGPAVTDFALLGKAVATAGCDVAKASGDTGEHVDDDPVEESLEIFKLRGALSTTTEFLY